MPQDSRRSAQRPSRTAEYAAAIRALHMRRDAPPVFADDLAWALCGPLWRTVTRSGILSAIVVDGILRRTAPIAPAVIARARYGEDRAALAVRQGIRQYVIIGAGYETFAMRRDDLTDGLAVYELDLPATQSEKRRRMAAAGIAEPPGVRYVAADLEREDVLSTLQRTDFDRSKPALCSWFGVTYYVSRPGIETALRNVVTGLAPGSSIMFDYLADPVAPEWTVLKRRCAAFVSRRGEPWISAFDPQTLPGELESLGFAETHHLKPEEVGPRLFDGRADIVYPAMFGLCHAATA